MRRGPTGKKLVLLAAAILLSLGCVEVGLRLLGIADPPLFAPHPDYGYLMKPGQTVSTRGIPVRINALGFRGPEIEVPKRESTLRIAFLGDSITYGGGAIAEEDLFVRRVARVLDERLSEDVEALNLSAPGWGIENMKGYVDSMGLHDSDVLVWVISATDLTRPRTALEEHGFRESKPLLRLSLVASSLRMRLRSGPRPQPEDRTTRRERNADLVDEALSRWKSMASVGVAFVPARESRPEYEDDLATFVARIREHGVPYIDLEERLPAARGGLYLDPIHLNAEGHERIARELGGFVLTVVRD